MRCCKKKRCHCPECRMQQKYTFKEFSKPPAPPPYGREDLWELQFCRWWGWNWVRKREEEMHPPKSAKGIRCATTPSHSLKHQPLCKTTPRQCSPAPQRHRHCHQPPKKSCMKNFCDSLFKRKRHECRPPSHMQHLYDTPSNSVVVCETYACGVLDGSNDTFEEINVRRSVSKQSRKEVCREKKIKTRSWATESSLSSEEDLEVEICCKAMAKRKDASSEETSNYINSRLEYLKETPQAPPYPERDRIAFTNTSAQVNLYEVEDKPRTHIATQTNYARGSTRCRGCRQYPQQYSTVKKCKTHKIRVTCCCCDEPNNPGTHENEKYIHENEKKTSLGPKDSVKREESKNRQENTNRNDSDSLKKEDTVQDVEDFSKPLDTYFSVLKPNTFFPPSKKPFPKFGKPSKNYSWLHTSLSDTITSKAWISEEFRSPISGRLYNIQPLKLNNENAEKEIDLPELIDISENLNYLKEIESFTKSDFEKRIMMDALCDAILSGDEKEFRKNSSIFLDRFAYDINRQNSSSYCRSANTFRSNKGKHRTSINADFGQQFSCHAKFQDKESWLDKNSAREKRDMFTEDDDFARNRWISEKSCGASSNFDLNIKEQISSKSLKSDLDCNFSGTTPNGLYSSAFTKTGLMCTVPIKYKNKPIKRSRSPNVESAANKKFKQTHCSTSGSERNFEKIFEKINELVEKSKTKNTEMVQNLFETLPKRTYRISPIQTHQNIEETYQKLLEDVTSNVSNRSSVSPPPTQGTAERVLTATSFIVCDTKSTIGDIGDVQVNDKKISRPQNTSTSRMSLIPVRKLSSFKTRSTRHKK